MKTKIFIVLSFLAAFAVSQLTVDHVFLAGTPKVNPFFLTNIKTDLKSTRDQIMVALSSPFKRLNQNTASIPETLFQPVSKGVSAYETEDERYIKIDKGTEYSVRQIKLPDGRVMKVIDLRK
jgi:hypothetical protein